MHTAWRERQRSRTRERASDLRSSGVGRSLWSAPQWHVCSSSLLPHPDKYSFIIKSSIKFYSMLPILGKTYYVLAMALYLVLNSIWNRPFSKLNLQKKYQNVCRAFIPACFRCARLCLLLSLPRVRVCTHVGAYVRADRRSSRPFFCHRLAIYSSGLSVYLSVCCRRCRWRHSSYSSSSSSSPSYPSYLASPPSVKSRRQGEDWRASLFSLSLSRLYSYSIVGRVRELGEGDPLRRREKCNWWWVINKPGFFQQKDRQAAFQPHRESGQREKGKEIGRKKRGNRTGRRKKMCVY